MPGSRPPGSKTFNYLPLVVLKYLYAFQFYVTELSGTESNGGSSSPGTWQTTAVSVHLKTQASETASSVTRYGFVRNHLCEWNEFTTTSETSPSLKTD